MGTAASRAVLGLRGLGRGSAAMQGSKALL